MHIARFLCTGWRKYIRLRLRRVLSNSNRRRYFQPRQGHALRDGRDGVGLPELRLGATPAKQPFPSVDPSHRKHVPLMTLPGDRERPTRLGKRLLVTDRKVGYVTPEPAWFQRCGEPARNPTTRRSGGPDAALSRLRCNPSTTRGSRSRQCKTCERVSLFKTSMVSTLSPFLVKSQAC
jgi:hypothetical protein